MTTPEEPSADEPIFMGYMSLPAELQAAIEADVASRSLKEALGQLPSMPPQAEEPGAVEELAREIEDFAPLHKEDAEKMIGEDADD